MKNCFVINKKELLELYPVDGGLRRFFVSKDKKTRSDRELRKYLGKKLFIRFQSAVNWDYIVARHNSYVLHKLIKKWKEKYCLG